MIFLKVLEVTNPRHVGTFGLRGAKFSLYPNFQATKIQSSTGKFCKPIILLPKHVRQF